MVVVEAPRWSSTEGTLTAFEKRRGGWTITQPTVRAQLGYGGLVRGDKRRQGTGTVPTGVFDILRGFGRKADPGTSLTYVQVDRNDAWTYNPRVPSTYNVFQTVDRSWNSYGGYVITTGAKGVRRNSTPPDTSRGGGIFLHVDNGNKTAGCIAVKKKVMRNLMKWLDPKKDPVIVIRVT